MTDFIRKMCASTPELLSVFDDDSILRAALSFEAALAHALAAHGLCTGDAAREIAALCKSIKLEPKRIAEEASLAGTLAIPLVKQLRAALSSEDARSVLHRGATSQDLADTVLMMQASRAATLVLADLDRIADALLPLAERYRSTPALGRTLLQAAMPVSFGLRIAQWLHAIVAARMQLARSCSESIGLEFGGPVGTRSGLGGHGEGVSAHLARALGLAVTVAPWHARRIGVASIASALGIATGAVGKFARDVSLLSQNEIREVSEPLIAGRGGSSAMAHKRNPTGCQVALSAAARIPGLVADVLAGLPQELERGLGGWQAEGPVLAEAFILAGGAARAMADVAEGLEIHAEAIERNLQRANVGADIGESDRIVAAIISDVRQMMKKR